jgi:hypothetical protein
MAPPSKQEGITVCEARAVIHLTFSEARDGSSGVRRAERFADAAEEHQPRFPSGPTPDKG